MSTRQPARRIKATAFAKACEAEAHAHYTCSPAEFQGKRWINDSPNAQQRRNARRDDKRAQDHADFLAEMRWEAAHAQD